MNDHRSHDKRESDWVSFRRSILVWWHGGESERQKTRRALGVESDDEGFRKTVSPKFHWTVLLIRKPLQIIHTYSSKILVTVIGGVIVAYIVMKWLQ